MNNESASAEGERESTAVPPSLTKNTQGPTALWDN
jgi:hypothetical protein